jgi:hypothetical protein
VATIYRRISKSQLITQQFETTFCPSTKSFVRKIKGGRFDMAGGRVLAGVAIGMLGSAIGKGDGDAATLLKKRRKAFDEQYLKVLVQGSRDHNAWN